MQNPNSERALNGQHKSLERIDSSKQYQSKYRLKEIVKMIKIKNIAETFIFKIKRNNIFSKPVSFELKDKPEPFIKVKGVDIQDTIESSILFLDILMTLTIFTISSFHAFLQAFRDTDCDCAAIVTLKILSLFVFIIRAFISFITIDIEDGIQYVYLVDIIKKQLTKGRFIIQSFFITMVVISLILPASQTVGIILFISCLPKVYIVQINFSILQLLKINTIKKAQYWGVAKLIVFNIFFAHFIASILLAITYIQPSNNWLQSKHIDPSVSWYQLYLWSYYWACTIMITVGFGDISPVIYQQAIVVAFIQILSSIIVAYNISEMGSIIQSIRLNSQALNKKIGLLRRVNKNKKGLSPQIVKMIQQYFINQIAIHEQFEQNHHEEMIKTLPQQLKRQYYSEAYRDLFDHLPFFAHTTKQTMIELSLAFKGRIYYRGEHIIKNKIGVNQVIILRKGEIGLLSNKSLSKLSGVVIEQFKIDQKQGNPYLVSGNLLARFDKLPYDIMANKYTYGLTMSKQQFMRIIKRSQLDYNYYLNIIDSHHNELSINNFMKCQNCREEYHTKFQCPRYHYIPLKSMIVYKYSNIDLCSDNMRRVRIKDNNFRVQKKNHCYKIKGELERLGVCIDENNGNILSVQAIKYASHYASKQKQLIIKEKGAITEESYYFAAEADNRLKLDMIHDFGHYFHNNNASALFEVSLKSKRMKISQKLKLTKSLQ